MLVLTVCELAAGPAAAPVPADRLLRLIRRHATVADGLEHLRARPAAGRFRLAAFLRREPPGDAPRVLRRLVRRALDREAALRHWHLIDDTTPGERHP